MNWITPAIAIFAAQALSAADFSADKIRHHSSDTRIGREAREYIRDLPYEAIIQIVDQLDFNKDSRGRNTFIMSFTYMKVKQLEAKGIDYDKDYVFSKSVSKKS